MGIRHRGHSFPTAHGIVFMNDLGVHLYNGETVLNLTGKMPDVSIPAFTSTAGANDVPTPQVNIVTPPENTLPNTNMTETQQAVLSGESYNSDLDTNNDGVVNILDIVQNISNNPNESTE